MRHWLCPIVKTFLAGLTDTSTTNRRLMSTTALWAERETSTTDSCFLSTIYQQSSSVWLTRR